MGTYPVVRWLLGAIFLWQLGHQVLPSIWSFYTISKFDWTERQVGYSLTWVGLVMAIAQGLLTRVLIPWLGGERRAALAGMAAALVRVISAMRSRPQGWMMYAVSLSTFIFALTYPSMNAIASQQAPPDAQGELQGAIACLYSLSAILGPPLMTQIFRYFSAATAPVHFPGAPFVAAALLTLGSATLLLRALRHAPPVASAAAARAEERGLNMLRSPGPLARTWRWRSASPVAHAAGAAAHPPRLRAACWRTSPTSRPLSRTRRRPTSPMNLRRAARS